MIGNKLINIRAKHKLTGETLDLKYYSIAEAKQYNPYLEEFRAVGIANLKDGF